MPEVTQSWRMVLSAMERSPSVWQTPAELAGRLGWDEERTTDELASLDVAGLILVREVDDFDRPVVALAPRSLDRAAPPRELAPRRREPALSR